MAVFLPSPLEILERKEMSTTISNVPTPSFLVDYDKVKKNAQKMVDTCERLGVQLRPHMKTHKTVYVLFLFISCTVIK